MSRRFFSRGSILVTWPRPSLEKALVLVSFSHTLKRSIWRSTSLRAVVSCDLSLMSELEILRVQAGGSAESRHCESHSLSCLLESGDSCEA